jgi:methyl-accepting chemotaxis protein/methyl-accepting chemotaxis protein-1 (serine sensor receptor)
MSLTKKLVVAFAALAAVLIIQSVVMLSGFLSMKSAMEKIARESSTKQFLASRFDADIQSMRSSQRGLQLFTTAKNSKKAAETRQQYAERMSKAVEELDRIESLGVSPEEAALIRDARSGLHEVEKYYAEIARFCDAGDGEGAAAFSASTAVSPYELAIRPALKLVDFEDQLLRRTQQDATTAMNRDLLFAFTLAVLGLATGAAALLTIRRANGTLRRTAHMLFEGAEQVASAAAQVSSSSQSLAQGASENAAAIQETSASSAELSSLTGTSSENTSAAAARMTDVARQVAESNEKLGQMVDSMHKINDSSDHISKIMKVIDAIAFQTNILALNAAVESARAGEAGLGFAVVADEVRNLAQRCAVAAKDTTDLIQESISEAGEGTHRLDQVGKSIAALTGFSEAAKTLVDEVYAASQEQTRGLKQITLAIRQMEQVSQMTAASAEQGAAAGEQLQAQSEMLKGISAELLALVDGHRDQIAV